MIEIKNYSELAPDIKQQLNFYVQEEFGHIPIVQQTSWATPNWTVLNWKDGEIATFYNIMERTVTIDHHSLKAAGVNNVITPKKYRRQGYATHTWQETKNFLFNNLKADIGLLLCADEMIPFYSALNWYQVDCPVYFNQPNQKKLWTANTMLLSQHKKLAPREIDLNGLPW